VISPRTYSLALIGLALAVAGTVSGLAWYLVPMPRKLELGTGDLTRIGWYSNNRYGNGKPQVRFEPALVRIAPSLDGPYDVVILGDSFSGDADKGWANHLAAKGLSVLVIPFAEDTAKGSQSDVEAIERQVAGLVESPSFREHPPGVFVFQSIERMLRRRLVHPAAPCAGEDPPEAPTPRPELHFGPPPAHRLAEFALSTAPRHDEHQLTYARDFLVNNVRKLFGWRPDVRLYELREPRFSSARPASLLVLLAEVRKSEWPEADLPVMRCQLFALQQRVQANGRTLFATLLIPDKLSAYHADLADTSPPRGVIERLADPRLNQVPADPALSAAIRAGDTDVYLPNDTHFGARGQQVTAEVVLEYIRSRTRVTAGAR
jgi:hypothetical protein